MKVKFDNTQEHETTGSFLSFKLENEHFAINVLKVMEILEVYKITKVPQAAKHYVGVVNLRGKVLPVVDTRIRFGLSPIEMTINTCILVLEVGTKEEAVKVGALVDSVSKVFNTEDSQIQPSPSIGARYKADFIQGVITEKDEFLMLLDVDKVFPINEVATVKEIQEEQIV
jgi:purine-binding chemotaxis protein CheW